MATLVLSAVGQVIGGPVGQVIGAIVGSVIDRAVIGGGKSRREGPRLADLAVQTASFGEPLPLVYGKSRIAGNIIWSSGLIERSSTSTSGSRKTGRTTTTNYSYFASFAVTLTGRAILRVERIWADGKLIRGSATDALSVGGQVRIYTGDEAQKADALLEAALGVNYAPNNRGVACAVFEELPLTEFANRVPNLTFEVVADEATECTQAKVTADLVRRAGVRDVAVAGLPTLCDAVVLADANGVRSTLEAMSALMPARAVATQSGLQFSPFEPLTPRVLQFTEWGASKENSAERQIPSRQRTAAHELPSEVEVRHIDSTRDYQAGVQRARRPKGGGKRQIDLPIVMDGSRAKRLAETMLARVWRERDRLLVRVPLARLDVQAGDVVELEGEDTIWRVTEKVMEEGGFTLSLIPLRLADLQSQAVADGGIQIGQVIAPHGPTVAHVMDLPPIEPSVPTTGRVLIAAAGASAGWRQASVWASPDSGVNYAQVAAVSLPTVMGSAVTALAAGSTSVWDLRNIVEIDLLSGSFELLSRTSAEVLAGANLACLGNELIQFTTVEPLSATRVRLRGLLRGRRGSEAFAGLHQVGERFVLLDPLPVDRDFPSLGLLGQTLLYKAPSPQQSLGDVAAQSLLYEARALRPLSPVHLSAVAGSGGDTVCAWVRRSRAGFDWIDGVDAPLAEDAETYQVAILVNNVVVRETTVSAASYTYPVAHRTADAVSGPLTFCVRQMSAQVGAGAASYLPL